MRCKNMRKERYFLKRNVYNNYRVIEELAKIVKSHNGYEVESVKPYVLEPAEYTITDRTTYSKMNELRNRILLSEKFLKEDFTDKTKEEREHLEKLKNVTRKNIEVHKKEIEELEKIAENTQVVTHHANYITFYYDNYIYSVSLNENPFFEHYFYKEKVDYTESKNYIVNYRYYGTQTNIDYYTNECFNVLSDNDIHKMAELLWQQLYNMKESDKSYTKTRVQNTFNSGYHYEKVIDKYKSEYTRI